MSKSLDVVSKDYELKFNDKGLIPAIVQDADTKNVLMLAYVNETSFKKTLETGETWFYSRSRQELWHKGATSGNTQKIKDIYYDCDQDTLLMLVKPAGPACHTGETSCFYRKLAKSTEKNAENVNNNDILELLYELISERKQELPDDSYTTYLFENGIDKILKKIGEESAEIIIASKNEPKEELIYETADFLYHLLVLLVEKEVSIDQI